MARKKFQLTGPAVTRGGNTVRQLAGLSHVYLDAGSVKANGTPTLDSDREAYVYTDETTRYGYYVLGSSLSPIEETPAQAKAEDFPEGRLVLVGGSPKTSVGGWVDPVFAGAVGRVGRQPHYGQNVTVRKLDGSDYNVIDASHLTLLPEGVDVAEKVARPELAFEDAIRKAAAHRDAVEGKSATDALIELAKLLVEVAK
jgi:hypothetical protein